MSEPREHDEPGQPEMLPGLARAAARRGRAPAKKPPVAAAEVDPVARVLVDLPLAHLDRPFDYLVPETMADDAVPGARVKVRFAGQDVDAYVVARAAASDHDGRLSPLRRVVSAEPVLAPEIAALSADVARRYAGARADVLRLAVPPRHATAEKKESVPAPPPDARTGGRRRSTGPSTSTAPPSRRRSPPGARRARSGRRPRVPTGRRCSPRRPWRRTPRAAGRCSASPTARTSTGWTPRCWPRWGRATTWRCGRTAARRRATATSWPSPAAPGASSSAPAPPRSRPCTTSAWSRSGTTATTCTPSPGRRTPTPARCCSPAPSGRAPPRWSAASRAPSRRSTSSPPAGPARSPRPGSRSASGSPSG